MSIYNLGSCLGAGALFENRTLDEKLHAVLDWLDGTECGLGEVIDRMQHLSACRSIAKKIPENETPSLDRRGNAHKKLNLDTSKIRTLIQHGCSYRQLAEMFNCSVGSIYNYAHGERETKSRIEHVMNCASNTQAEGRE